MLLNKARKIKKWTIDSMHKEIAAFKSIQFIKVSNKCKNRRRKNKTKKKKLSKTLKRISKKIWICFKIKLD